MKPVIDRSAEKRKAGNRTVAIPGFLSGGAKRDRTADLHTASVALSQLSYGPGAMDPAIRCGREYSHEHMAVSTPFEGR
jgi:hypothetical protein